ncbi:MAG: HlyD family type I secretion periplasmic adaptor subunit [Rhodospirillaceae bacterium]|nr:HlyD family type I secretion periplasmic adaptor subunit [Rhodospirillales bacterium]
MTSQSLVPKSPDLPALHKQAPHSVVKQSSRVTRHLAQAVQLEESGTAPLIRFTMVMASVACLAFVGWAAVTHIDEVAVTEGEVVPTGSVQTVQHLEGGLVEEVLVKEGELVDRDQALVRLSPAASLADLDQTRAREMTLLLKAERLRAFADNRQPDFSFGKGYERLVADNLSIYQGQIQSRDSARSVTLSQIDQKRSDLHVLEGQQSALREQISSLSQVMGMKEELVNKGLISRVNYLDTKRELARVQGELSRTVGQSITARDALREMEQRLVDQNSTLHKQAMDDMGVTVSELAQVQETIGRLEDKVKRLMLVSPARGYVKGLTVRNTGAVIQPGGLLCEVVPVDREMKVEAKVLPRDIGHIKIGQPVKVKVTTFDFARYGAIRGELQGISATTFINEKGEPFYKAQVKLSQGYVGSDPAMRVVTPGMTAQAEIITGEKTLLQYMLKPIFTQMQESFHER